MGYYTISLDPDASKICNIIIPGVRTCTSGYQLVLQALPTSSKMSEPMAALEFVRPYLDDLLYITRASLDNHLEHLMVVLIRLQEVGLKVHAPKSKFCAKETEYLGYILTKDGIKPQPNKVQAILASTPPKGVKDLRRFLGIAQYYRDHKQEN